MSAYTWDEMISDVEQMTAAFPGKAAVWLHTEDQQYERFGTDRVVSASMIKVPILWCLEETLREQEKSMTSRLLVSSDRILDDSMVFDQGPREASLYELAYWMITYSDNTSTNMLIDYLGYERLNAFFRAKGLDQTSCNRKMLDWTAVKEGRNNYISPADYFTAFHAVSMTGRDLLRQNRDSDAILRYIYEGPEFWHKTGELDDIAHDGGELVWNGQHVDLGIFCSEFDPKVTSSEDARRFIGRVARKVFDYIRANPADI